MAKLFKTTFKLRRGSSEAWDKNNPILAYGEPGFDKDQYIFKIGDGSKNWRDLKPIGAITNEDIDTRVAIHNESTVAHNDIRALIQQLSNRLNLLANSDDVTLDQMNEIVTYIKNNKSLIDSITIAKVNVSDIINDLVTNVSNKPLSAAQGVMLKELIDSLEKTLESYALKSDIKEAPVQSVNGQTGNVEITVDSIGAQPAGNYALQSDIDNLGKLSKKDIVEKSDFASDVQTSLNKADTALQSYTETDPTVPAWAKEPTKPTYTASEVGALPDTTEIPSIGGLATEDYVDDAIAAIPTPDVSGQIETHNTSTDAHSNMGWLTGEDEIVDSPVPIDADTLGGRSASYFEDKIAEIKNNNTVSSCIKGSGAPTESTVADVGFFYMDILTGDVWKCVAVDEAVGKYTWTRLVADEIAVEPEEDDIPKVFFGCTLPQTKTDTIMPFRYISKTEDIRGYCKTKAQGNSSMGYPKKNQTVKLYKDAACTEKLKVNFKGWGKQNKFCFKANWIDLTHARNIVSARLWSDIVKSRSNYSEIPEELRTSPNQGAIDGFPVKVYANGVYQGRYTINIPKDAWMSNMDEDLDEHCILCGENYVSGCFRAEATIDETDWTDEVHDNVPESIKARWNEIIRFVMNSTDDEFVAGIGAYFDVQSLIDYYLFGLVSCGLDAFGKNQLYMTYDGRKWFATMYDMDSTWGLWWTGASFVNTNYARTEFQDFKDGEGNLLYIRLETLFCEQINERWEELRNGVLSIDSIIDRFERFIDVTPKSLVEEDYAASTANGAFTFIPSQIDNNIQQIRAYAADRLLYCRSYIETLHQIDSDYTVVDYLESTGTQYIDTGIYGGTNPSYEIKFNPLGVLARNYEHYFGGPKPTATPKVFNYDDSNIASIVSEVDSEPGVIRLRLLKPTDFAGDITLKYNSDGSIYVDQDCLDPYNTVNKTWGGLTWYVFNSHSEPNLASIMRLYYLKMWTDGELVRDFIPVVRNSDGVACLYDLVTGHYFENIGTGEFVVPA